MDKRDKAPHRVKEDKPFMPIVSPMCGPSSALPTLFNYSKQKRAYVKERATEQHINGRLFIFEHPAEASSWGTNAMHQMRALDGVRVVKFDFCMLGMTTDDDGKEAAARKRTRVMTNSSSVAVLLQEAQCRSEHVHQHLLGNRAGPCQEYTDKLCKLICEAIKR